MKRVLSLVLAFMLVLTSIMPAFAEDSMDSEAGKALESYGVIAGTGNGLDEGSALTRAQMTVILSQMYGMKAEAEAYAFAPSFTDVPEGQWFTPYVAFAEQKGWMSGDAAGGTFRPNDAMKAQEVNAMFLKALGYTVEWADVNMKAEEIKIGVTAADTTSVLRGEAFAAMVEVLNTPKMDETDTLGTKLALPNYEPPTPPVTAVKVKSAVALNSKVVEVTLTDAAETVNASIFEVMQGSDAVAVKSAEFAPWSTTKKAVLVTLETETKAGTLYTVKSGETSANFGGRAADTTKPTVSEVKQSDFNEFTIVFSEAVMIGDLTVTVAEKYGDKAALAVTGFEYSDSKTITVKTADQAASKLYGTTIKGAADLAGNVMKDDTNDTFVGIAKSTATQKVNAVKAIDYNQVYVEFATNVDFTTLADATWKLEKAYDDKTTVTVLSAAQATKAQTKEFDSTNTTSTLQTAATKKGVVLTVEGTMTTSTLYKLTADKVMTLYGKEMSTTSSDMSKTFVGMSKPTGTFGLDTVKPASATTIEITFARKIEADPASVIDNFTVAEAYGDKTALTITNAELKDDMKTVKLTVSEMKAVLYKVTTKNQMDIYGNAQKTGTDAEKTFVGTAPQTKITSMTITRVDGSDTQIEVKFNKNVDSSAADVSKYSIDSEVGYPEAVSLKSGTTDTVVLTIPKTTEQKIYKLTVKNVANADGVAMDAAGITQTFTGKGIAQGLPTIEAVVPVDKKTVKLYFDRDVSGSDVKGLGLVWENETTVNAFFNVKKNKTGETAATLAGLKAYTDSSNKNILYIVDAEDSWATGDGYSTYTFDITSAFENKVKFGTDITSLEVAATGTSYKAPKVVGVTAVDNATVKVFFDKPVTSFDIGDIVIKKSSDSSVVAHKAPIAVVGTQDKEWLVPMNAVTLEAISYKATFTTSAIQDKYVAINLDDENTSATDADLVKEFAGNSTAAVAVTDIHAIMKDSRTIEVVYPEAMQYTAVAAVASDVDFAAHYEITKVDGSTLTGAPAITFVEYSTTTNRATLHLGADLPSEITTTFGVKIKTDSAKEILNLAGTKRVDADTDSDTEAKQIEVAKSSTTNKGPSISSVTVSGDRKQIVVGLSETAGFGNVASWALDVNGTTADNEIPRKVKTAGYDISTTNIFAALKVNTTLIGESAAGDLDNTDVSTVAISKDGKTITFNLNTSVKPGAEGYVTTKVGTANAAYTLFNYGKIARSQTADESKVTFGAPTSSTGDYTPPTVTAISATDGSYKAGDVVNVEVVFSENVNVTGTPQLDLDTLNNVNYTSGSGTNKLVFAYTVVAGHTAADLDNVVNGLDLNSGTIKDGNNNAANLAIADDLMGANNAVVIDTTAPSVANAITQNNHATVITVTLTELNDLFIGSQKVNDAADHTTSWTVTDTRSTLTADDVIVMSAAGSPVLSITLPDANTGVEAGSIKINLNQVLDAAGNAVVNGTTPANTVLTITDGGATWSAAFGAN